MTDPWIPGGRRDRRGSGPAGIACRPNTNHEDGRHGAQAREESDSQRALETPTEPGHKGSYVKSHDAWTSSGTDS